MYLLNSLSAQNKQLDLWREMEKQLMHFAYLSTTPETNLLFQFHCPNNRSGRVGSFQSLIPGVTSVYPIPIRLVSTT
jgi:hypothetical protein